MGQREGGSVFPTALYLLNCAVLYDTVLYCTVLCYVARYHTRGDGKDGGGDRASAASVSGVEVEREE